jgi:tRNA modification GTPase
MNMINASETICAIATPPGKGAISIIRMSGSEAKQIISGIFTPHKSNTNWLQQTYTLHYGSIRKQHELLDDVLVSVFNAPHSYTGEDSVEINCHASRYIQNEILQLLISSGARLAQPGEFTMRAYLNGKLDLSQAEAVADLLASSSEASHKLAISQMKGGYSKELGTLRHKLLHFLAMLELELDFSEEEVEFANRHELHALVIDVAARINHLLQSFAVGNVIKEGVPVCIIGEPNVGKSSLLNAILNEDKAIVSEIPGTTRDIIEDTVVISGVTFRFMDTAGIRNTSDTIERLGIDRTFDKVSRASIVLLLVDVTSPIVQIKHNIRSIKAHISEDTRVYIVVNKIDLITEDQLEDRFCCSFTEQLDKQDAIVYISAKQKKNIQNLITLLVESVTISQISEHDVILTNTRHYEAFLRAKESIDNVIEGLDSGLTHDLISLELRQALHYIGSITGTITNDEMLGHIFQNFCIGK